jgi:hypothetical protein
MTTSKAIAIAVGIAVLAALGWQVIATTRVDRLAQAGDEAVLQLDPDQPQALLLRARWQLANGDDRGALATARHLLAVAPGQGDAFAIIALAADRMKAPNSGQLLEIASRRAPRVSQVRARLATIRLQAGDLPGALAQLDALLRFEPAQGDRFFPALAQQSADPRFAQAMAATLARQPPWRRGFLQALDKNGSPTAINNVYGNLQRQGGLSASETRRWLDSLIARGRWGDAFSGWFGTLHPAPKRIPAVRNGGFEDDIDGVGFGWRNAVSPGVFTDIEDAAGRDGSRAAHLHFIGRPAPRGNLRQPLLLVPGRYRLSLQARADDLRSDRGLQWGIRCDRGPWIGGSEPIDGSFDWRAIAAEFEVPAQRCEGQWLELRNPAVRGTAQKVSGDLWIDDVAITPRGAG